jgi:S1-C subfamily serine protease
MKRLAFLLVVLISAIVAQAADHAFLGVVPDKSIEVNVQGYSGAGLLLKQVVAKGPASLAGLRGGDILTHFNGKPLEDSDDLSFFLRKAKPGDKVSLDWVRDNARMKGTAKLGARDVPETSGKSSAQDMARSLTSTAFLGIGSLAINQNLLAYFGVKEGHGILIDAIVKGSPAEKAGLKVGDVLVDMDGHAVDSPGRLRRLMETYRPGAKARLTLVRSRQPVTVDIVFSNRDSSCLDQLDLPGLPDVPGMPEMPRLPELPDLEGLGNYPGRAAVDSTLDLLRRFIGPPLALLEN